MSRDLVELKREASSAYAECFQRCEQVKRLLGELRLGREAAMTLDDNGELVEKYDESILDTEDLLNDMTDTLAELHLAEQEAIILLQMSA